MAQVVEVADQLGSFIVLPGEILAKMDSVRAQIQAFDRVVKGSNATPDFKSSWASFVQEYESFYASNSGWWSRATSGPYDEAERFQTRLRQWQDSWERLTGQDVPGAKAPEAPAPPFSDLLKYLPWVVGGVAAFMLLPAVPSILALIPRKQKALSGLNPRRRRRAQRRRR